MEDELLKAVEVAERLKISRAKAYQLIARGEIPAVRIGTSVRVKRSELELYIHEHGIRQETRV